MEKYLVNLKCELYRWRSRVAALFARSESHERGIVYLKGSICNSERKSGWHVSERMGNAAPYVVRRLLDRSSWEMGAACDHVLGVELEELSNAEPLTVADETDFLKKDRSSVGVMRRCTAKDGRRIEEQLDHSSYWFHAQMDKTMLDVLVRVVAQSRRIEHAIEMARIEWGLDHFEDAKSKTVIHERTRADFSVVGQRLDPCSYHSATLRGLSLISSYDGGLGSRALTLLSGRGV